jgi:Sec-independent protein secretion pathway component TatC
MPVVAVLLARAGMIERNLSRIMLLGTIAALLTLGFELTHVVTPSAQFVWPCPLACLAFLGFVVFEIAAARDGDRLTLTKTASQVIQPTEFQCST